MQIQQQQSGRVSRMGMNRTVTVGSANSGGGSKRSSLYGGGPVSPLCPVPEHDFDGEEEEEDVEEEANAKEEDVTNASVDVLLSNESSEMMAEFALEDFLDVESTRSNLVVSHSSGNYVDSAMGWVDPLRSDGLYEPAYDAKTGARRVASDPPPSTHDTDVKSTDFNSKLATAV